VVVGGDYTKESESTNNTAITKDGGRTWTTISNSRPNGYRSLVAYVHSAPASTLLVVAVGPSGSDYSTDHGESWHSLSADGFHTASFASGTGWAAGENGRLAKYISALTPTRK